MASTYIEVPPKAEIHRKDVFPFLRLPGELRNLIYKYCGDFNEALDHIYDYATDPEPIRSTPNILLLNRKITEEALGIVRKEPLVIDLCNDRLLDNMAWLDDVFGDDTLFETMKVIFPIPEVANEQEMFAASNQGTVHWYYPIQCANWVRFFYFHTGLFLNRFEYIYVVVEGEKEFFLSFGEDPDHTCSLLGKFCESQASSEAIWEDGVGAWYKPLEDFVLSQGGTVCSLNEAK